MANAQATTMRVNYDVLFNIMDLSEAQSDFGRLMRTCWTLYEAGVPRLLRRLGGRISIYTRKALLSFCAFMLQKNSNRFQHLVALGIHLDRPFYKDACKNKFVALMFLNASRLETLKLSDPEYLLTDPAVPRAIASLTSLRELIIRDVTNEVIPVLEKTRSLIRKVSISFDHDFAKDGGDPIPLLKNLAHSLEELDVSWVGLEAIDVKYPRLAILHLGNCDYTPFETLYSAFPNLRSLSLCSDLEDGWEDELAGWWHQRNLLAQADYGTWQSLSYVRASIPTLYSLALQCRVEHLDIRQCGLVREGCDLLRAVLSAVQPSAVSLFLYAQAFDMQFLGTALRPSVHTLHELFLDIDFYGEEYVDPSPALVRLVNINAICSLTSGATITAGNDAANAVPAFDSTTAHVLGVGLCPALARPRLLRKSG